MFYYDVGGVFQCPVKGSPYPFNKNIFIIIIYYYYINGDPQCYVLKLCNLQLLPSYSAIFGNVKMVTRNVMC